MNGQKKRKKGKKKREVGVYSRLKWARRHIQLEPNKKDRERESKDRQLIRTQNKKPKTKNMSAPQTNPMP